ncbi:MAG: ABC transporter substrate-binding protein [Erysipelotrichaceae bacterium]|nr:ABC transporter substrate-binding protein [Erysipelotrichaceae bacterium]
MKKLLVLVLSLFMVLSLAGCKDQKDPPSQEIDTSIVITDQIGRQVTLEKPAEKVVSTYYLVTASLLTLGLKDRIVGVELKANSRQLYRLAAKEMLELPGVGSGKEINIEEIAKLEPDIVFLPKKQKDAAEVLSDLGIPSIVVDPESYDRFNELIMIIGKVCGVEDRATQLISYYDGVVDEVSSLAEDATRPSVYIAGDSSWLHTCTGKMYQSEMTKIAGGECVSASLDSDKWTDISIEQLLQWDPEYIFVVNYAEYGIDDLMNEETLKDLKAVKENKVFMIPSAIEAWDYPQPSSVLGLYWMAGILHPELVAPDRYLEEALAFYKTYYDLDLSNEDF